MYRVEEITTWKDGYGTGDSIPITAYQIKREFTPAELNNQNVKYSEEVVKKGRLIDTVSVREVAQIYVDHKNSEEEMARFMESTITKN